MSVDSRDTGGRIAQLCVVHPPELAGTIALGAERVPLEGIGVPEAIEWDGDAHRCVGAGVTARALDDGCVLRLGPALLVYERCAPGETANAVSCAAIPGQARATRRLRAEVAEVAADPSPVLLIGETGTGKESIASEIHRLSQRRGQLVAINCAALSPQLIDSQLFGHVRGAFTGANGDQPGLFRAAQGGTLLLDEIGELPLELQPKLLRVLQERVVLPVGGSQSVSVDVRVVAATNRDLAALVEEGGFRRDLYARLSLWQIAVPALRDRRADLFAWLSRLLERFCAERGLERSRPVFEIAAAHRLLLDAWPENLRGLDRLVHALGRRMAAGQMVTAEELPGWMGGTRRGAATSPGGGRRQPIPGPDEIRAVFRDRNGSVRATAKHFGRDRRQIYRWIAAYGLRE